MCSNSNLIVLKLIYLTLGAFKNDVTEIGEGERGCQFYDDMYEVESK